MRVVTAAVSALLLVGAVGAVGGCSGGDGEPSTLPPLPSVRASAGVAPSAQASSGPRPSASGSKPSSSSSVGAVPSSAEGASAFAREYFTVLQGALATGDTTKLRGLSDGGCGGCGNLIQAIEAAKTQQRKVQGAAFSVLYAEAPPLESGETIVDVRYTRDAGQVIDAEASVIESFPAEGPIDAQLRLRVRGPSWIVLGFRQVDA